VAELFSLHGLDHLFAQYGYAVVGLGVMLEATGLPLPGESLMIAAALYAAATHRLDIFIIVPVAAAGAIVGVLARFGRRIGLSEERLELGRYLFRRYGGRVVFLGRFVAVLRTFVALLAGANQMAWRSFLMWNALGGIGWTALYGFGAYVLGDAVKRVSGPVGLVLAVVGAAAIVAALVFVKRNERRLLDEARAEMKKPAPPLGWRRKPA